MSINKTSKIKLNNIKILSIFLVLMLLLSNNINAQNTNFCDQVIPQQGSFGGQNILDIAFILMLVMAFVIGIAYLLGYSFKIDKLVKFAKSEFGEIIVTGIILAIFGGFIFAVNGMSGVTSTQVSSYRNIYLIDCNNFYQTSVTTLYEFKSLFISQFTLQFLGSFYIKIKKFTANFFEKALYGFGFGLEPQSFTPFGGLGMIYSVFIVNLINIDAGLSGLLLIIAFILGIFYTMLPFFFYLGIIFRAFPWTRAMGGAFLALFIAFYFVFPLLVFTMLIVPCSNSSTNTCENIQALQNSPQSILNSIPSLTPSFITGLFSSFFNIFSSLIKGWDFSSLFGDFSTTIYNTIAPAIYDLLVIVISLLISYDLLEGLADLLGAPSLTSKHALKKVI
ncbi:MAG: hypothetical protein ACP5RQ_02100 [Candidatus Micrarchaeia archaeon]